MRKLNIIICFAYAALFTLLFYRNSTGLNLMLFEVSVIIAVLLKEKIKPVHANGAAVLSGTLLTAIFVITTHSILSILVNIFSFFLLSGVLINLEAKSLLSSFRLAGNNIPTSQIHFIREIFNAEKSNNSLWKLLKKIRIVLIPILIVIVFVVLYNFSNALFGQYLNRMISGISDFLTDAFYFINVELLIIFLFGLGVSIYFFFRVRNEKICNQDKYSSDVLLRTKKSRSYRMVRMNSLKNEWRAGLFLLVTLNILILMINVIDIYWVWFNFEWNGQYLKQFVHEGTWLLIISILISMAITLYFFRGNLNFYARSKWLRFAGNVWMIQNAILAISVLIRNYWYIHFYALAYGRIAVLFFILLTLFGIATVIIKINNKKSLFWLVRRNGFAFYLLVILVSAFNWDCIIANYNFSHYKTAFVHFDYLAELSDKALPSLEKSWTELEVIATEQQKQFAFNEKYLDPQSYHKIIQERKKSFITKWESKNILEWNYPEYNAYKKLKEK